MFTEEKQLQLEKECTFSASRSSGPGGQNVNKVSSRVELRFSVIHSEWLTDDEKQRILTKLKNHINIDGELIFSEQTSRSQLENKALVLVKFFDRIEKALIIPKKRLKSKPTKASVFERIETKKKTGQKKQLRRPPEI